ncbi:MAG: glycosyltransferase family 1 protein [Actinomycetota bacterium]
MAASRPSASPPHLRIAVPVEQFWHRVPGGTARATRETLQALQALDGVNIQGIAAWHGAGDRARAGTVGPVTYARLPRPALYEGWLRFRRPRVERLVGPVDLVWAASMIMAPTVAAPVVATVHDLGFLDLPANNSRRGRTFFPRAWEAVRRRADHVVCPSQAVADACTERGLDPARVSVVPWGVGPPISSAEAAEAVVARHTLPSRFVLWVGTIEPRKNLPILVEAMQQLADHHLVVVGPDGWNLDGDDLLAPLGARAHRLGHVDDHELSALYRAATVFAFPSLLEGFGLPVLEALAHGTPVVTAQGTATEEVAGGGARLIDPHDAAALASAIEAVETDPATTARLATVGRRRAQELTWANTAARYRDVFARVAAGDRP